MDAEITAAALDRLLTEYAFAVAHLRQLQADAGPGTPRETRARIVNAELVVDEMTAYILTPRAPTPVG